MSVGANFTGEQLSNAFTKALENQDLIVLGNISAGIDFNAAASVLTETLQQAASTSLGLG